MGLGTEPLATDLHGSARILSQGTAPAVPFSCVEWRRGAPTPIFQSEEVNRKPAPVALNFLTNASCLVCSSFRTESVNSQSGGRGALSGQESQCCNLKSASAESKALPSRW